VLTQRLRNPFAKCASAVDGVAHEQVIPAERKASKARAGGEPEVDERAVPFSARSLLECSTVAAEAPVMVPGVQISSCPARNSPPFREDRGGVEHRWSRRLMTLGVEPEWRRFSSP